MMLNKLKNFKIIALICTFVVLCCAPVGAAGNMSAVFQYDSRSLHIDGNFGDSYAAPVIVVVTKDGASPSEAPASIRQYYAGDNGAILIDLPISKELGNGKYWVKVVTENGTFTDSFMYLNNTSTETDSIIALINAAQSASALHSVVLHDADKIGIDLSRFNASYVEYASNLVYSAKAFYGGSYDMSEFNTAFNTGLAVAMMNYDSVDSALSAYSSVFGITYGTYQAFGTDYKSVLDGFLKNANYSVKNAKDVYKDCILLTDVQMAGTWYDLSETVMNSASYLGISSTSNYYNIPEESRYRVFAELINCKSSLTTTKILADTFEQYATSVWDDINSSSGGSGSSGGFSGGGGGATVVVEPAEKVETPAVNNTVVLTDINGHWSESSVKTMVEKGVITGFGDKTFKPDNAVTRAEFAAIIMRAFEFEKSNAALFDDVQANAWYADAVATLSNNGIINGYDNKFNPDSNISRQDAATIIARVLGGKGVDLTDAYKFEDSSLISNYAASSVEGLASAGLLKGDGYNFRPHDMISRAETAVIIDRIFDMFEDVIK